MNKNTPGPWMYPGKDFDIETTNGAPVLDTGCGCCSDHTASEEDLILMAAAPELLQMLQEIVNKNLLNGAMLKDARAVIAKAKGENNE